MALPWHAHRWSSFCFILGGSMLEEVRGRPLSLQRHDLAFKTAGVEHRDRFGAQGAECLILELEPEWLESLGMFSAGSPHLTSFRSARATDICLRLASELRSPDVVAPLAIESCCLELLVLLSRETRRGPVAPQPWLRRARDLVIERHRENFSIAALAQEVGVHPVHLAQSFRRVYGTAVVEFARSLRVRTAATALASSDRPIASIAVACGFYDQAHLTRTFKRLNACTPAEFRRRHREGPPAN
jgi:AraC family transcriptional regulator